MNNDGLHVHHYEEAYSVILHVFAAPPTLMEIIGKWRASN